MHVLGHVQEHPVGMPLPARPSLSAQVLNAVQKANIVEVCPPKLYEMEEARVTSKGLQREVKVH